ncbi:MAG TPA: ABC transporter ATP-binding protein [Propionibacteriaceae bacterium]|nr:ABC transporter ATP-binding protein [Propionibacteriaceae bacterium]
MTMSTSGERAVARREDRADPGNVGLLECDVLLLDQPTNAHDPASRAEVLSAIGRHTAAILVTHDEGLWTPSTLIECCCFRTVFWKIFGARSTRSWPPWPDQVVDHSLERIISGPEIIWPLLL